MKGRCYLLIVWTTLLIGCSLVHAEDSHKLVKRQSPVRSGGGGFPLSRRRQFPPPEELEESEYVDSDEDVKNVAPAFRGRQPSALPEEDYPDDQSYTEAPKVTTPSPPQPTPRISIFNNRFNARPRFGAQTTVKTTPSTKAPASAASSGRATPAQSQRLDVVANILNRPPPPRSDARALPPARSANANVVKTPEPEVSTRRSSNSQRPRGRGRLRTRTSSTSTTTTTTTTQAPPPEEYYYYYEDEDEGPKNQPIATTTSTTTTTTTTTPRPRPSINRPRPVSSRTRTSSARPPVKFDPESQFAPPPEEPVDIKAETTGAPKRFTTSSTPRPEDTGGIPAHLRHKYRPRTDGRFIDFLRDPNRPRELKGFDLTDYPFYIVVPDDIDFDCDDKKDGYYASVPHKCQLFHYCFAGARYDFLCANYTLYDQTTFTCRFANNVDCESSAKYFYRNDDLWKEEATTTEAPAKPPKRKSRPRPRDEDYEEDYYDYESEEEEERRRRPLKRRRNRRKNRRRPSEEEEDEEKKKK
ncbi:hypothetical protein AVEN_52728-1 [Araneus ventricosus]|uniref:Chitin-binding type-2 domain-containing protein n=1 Tax=Araneus ventricosus TaxID=182803 RepID=A0A4Y2II30_ARAVE|nr:hypothetical protein AVEN_52728-1 [Araneus ventricosus]